MSDDPRLEIALREFELTAANFAVRVVSMTQVRTEYMRMIREMSDGIRESVRGGEITPRRGAELANEMRNEIMRMQRLRDLDLGRSLARSMKQTGLSLDDAILSAMRKPHLGVAGRSLETLTDAEQRLVFVEAVASAGRPQARITAALPRLRWSARGLWIASALIAGYNVGTSGNPWWQAGREGSAVAGGLGGGFAGGAAAGALGGVWAGPIGVGIGILVGGVLGSWAACSARCSRTMRTWRRRARATRRRASSSRASRPPCVGPTRRGWRARSRPSTA
jgi:hypothetical protein